ncbi:MAG: MgtC/SapB family protein [Bacteroidota bacterium]
MFEQGVVPPLLIQFGLTLTLSFVIGLEVHSYRRANQLDLGFGTTRTFTLIGVLGFLLYALDERGLLYGIGFLVLAGFLLIYYTKRVAEPQFSLLSSLMALLTYFVGPVAVRFPDWFLILYVVILLLLMGEKPGIRRFSDAFQGRETVTFAKFLIMAGVILPLLPERPIAPFIDVTFYQVWLAMVVVSGVSYLSYLAQTFFFKERGLLLTGILGGLYSSTATTAVLARQSVETGDTRPVSPAMILATAMMYLRLWLLILVLGYQDAALRLVAPFLWFAIASAVVALILYRRQPAAPKGTPAAALKHPLELSTAALFAVLFAAFAALTQIIVSHYGSIGLHILSFLTGLTDIDPFILSLLAGKYQVSSVQIAGAILTASGSNNLFKCGYALALARSRAVIPAAGWLGALFAMTVAYVYWIL